MLLISMILKVKRACRCFNSYRILIRLHGAFTFINHTHPMHMKIKAAKIRRLTLNFQLTARILLYLWRIDGLSAELRGLTPALVKFPRPNVCEWSGNRLLVMLSSNENVYLRAGDGVVWRLPSSLIDCTAASDDGRSDGLSWVAFIFVSSLLHVSSWSTPPFLWPLVLSVRMQQCWLNYVTWTNGLFMWDNSRG